jgi:glyoxylase-like metal-dependent hydrolase (beta-lactamase superfamily II)
MKEKQSTVDLRAASGQSFPHGGLVDLARDNYQHTSLTVTQVRPNIFAFSGAGGTVTAVSGSQGCAVIDTGYGPRVSEIRHGIASVMHQAPRWLVNTHWHFDHTDGNSAFTESGATIVAHANCRARLSQNQYVPSLEWRVPAAPRTAWPTIIIDAPNAIDLGGETLQLIRERPAHTDGDVAVWLPSSNVMIMGDLLVNGSYPIIDESSRGSLRGMIEAIAQFLQVVNADTVVVPGHGPIGDRQTLLGFLEMLCAIEASIQPMIASRLPTAEIIAAAPTADFDPVWGRGYVSGDTFLRMVLAGCGLGTRQDSSGSQT